MEQLRFAAVYSRTAAMESNVSFSKPAWPWRDSEVLDRTDDEMGGKLREKQWNTFRILLFLYTRTRVRAFMKG